MGTREKRGREVLSQVSQAIQTRLQSVRASGAERVSGLPRGTFEKIIFRTGRPSILVRDDTFVPEGPAALRDALIAAKPRLEGCIRAVGRLEVESHGRSEHMGTAWLVAPNIAVTNRHVALTFARFGADGSYPFRVDAAGRMFAARVDFKEEFERFTESTFKVRAVRFIAPDDGAAPDLAIIELVSTNQDGEPLPPPLRLSALDAAPDRLVAAIGYPAFDPDEEDSAAMEAYFGDAFGYKRIAPGSVMRSPNPLPGWGFAHDCTTLGGSSGTALVDLEDGSVVGLHFAGISGVANFAVRAGTVAAQLAQIGIEAKLLEPQPEPDGGVEAVRALEERRGGIRAPAHFKDREGFITDFLGVDLPLPQPVAGGLGEAAVVDGGGIELRYTHFSVIQNASRRLPWITGVNIDGNSLRRPPRERSWFRDGRIDEAVQAGDEVYANSGFSRGHMVRRLDPCWGDDAVAKQANQDTFLFTNACPQEQDAFNDGVWGDLEDYILDEADAEDLRINVYTGPIFTEEDPLVRDLPIPLSFWKVVAWKKGGVLRAVGFVLSQRPHIDIVEFAGGPYQTSERSLKRIARDAGVAWNPELIAADVNGATEGSARVIRDLRSLDRHFGR